MVDYPYAGILVADAVTFRRATSAAVTVYDVNDTASATPLVLKDLSGLPLPNPLTSSADGFVQPFVTTSEGVKLVGGGLTVVEYSHKGMQDAASAAATAAQTAANNASTAAAEVVTTAAVNGAGKLILTKASGATQDAGSVIGPAGPVGPKGADGANVLPTDDAIEAAILGAGTKTKAALSATYAPATGSTAYAAKSYEATIDAARTLATRGIAYGLRPIRKMVGFFGKAGHGWTGTGGTINLNDTTRPLLGTQSISITPAANGSAQIDKTFTAINATKSCVRVTFRYTGSITSIVIYLASDTGLANRMQRNVLSTTAYLPDTDYTIDVPLSEFNIVTGTPDPASIVLARVLANAGSTGGTLWVGQIALTDDASALAPNGLITLSFDDSNIDHYNVARPKMAEYGMAGTIYPQISNIGNGAGFMSLAQMKFLQDIHGWDFGAHAYDSAHHVDHVGQTEAWLRSHFESIVQWMKDNNFRGSSFAWPNTTSDTLAQRVAADYFSSGRGGGSMADTMPPTQPFRSRAYNAGSYTLAQMQANIDTAKNVKGVGWCHIFFHSLPTTKVNANDFAKADFDALIDYIAASGMKVVTASQAMKLAASI